MQSKEEAETPNDSQSRGGTLGSITCIVYPGEERERHALMQMCGCLYRCSQGDQGSVTGHKSTIPCKGECSSRPDQTRIHISRQNSSESDWLRGVAVESDQGPFSYESYNLNYFS